jgi:predicted kinase
MDLVIFIGLQAAGKSTFYRDRFAATHALVSKDRLRNNPRPQRRQLRLVEEALTAGRDVVVDNTNLNAADRAPLIVLGKAHGAAIHGYYFAARLEDCLERNRQRAGKACVPEIALFAAVKKLERPSLDEGFDRLFQVRLGPEGTFEVADWNEGPGDETR